MKDIIQILKSSNQELFYSSFIAWMLDCNGDHGLGSKFSEWMLTRLDLSPSETKVETEQQVKGGRADILLTTKEGKRILFENKTKSLGTPSQLLQYEEVGTLVVPLGLVKENFSEDVRSRVISYDEIRTFLADTVPPDGELSILIKHFQHHIENLLGPFSVLDEYCLEKIDLETARSKMRKFVPISENQNDRRFFHVVYFERLVRYFMTSVPALILGDSGYWWNGAPFEKPEATAWQTEKNMQGPAFLESIVYSGNVKGKISVKSSWQEKFSASQDFTLAPRLELWSNPLQILENERVGVFQLGCWNDELKREFSSSSLFRRRGSRNFHHIELSPSDIRYSEMSRIIKNEMGKIWEFAT